MRSGYAVTNGIRVFYVEEGEGPLVLLLHGWPEFWWSWRHQLGPLAQAGFRAVAIDLPGYGRSDKPDVSYDVVWVNACLAGLVDALGHRQAVVVGHDWGGLLAWPFARMYPEKTAGVVGLNTPDLPRPPAPVPELLRRMSPDEPPYIVQFQERGAAEFFIELDVDGFLRFVFRGPVTRNLDAFPDEVIDHYAEQFRPRGAMTPPLEYYRSMARNWELTEPIAGVPVEAPALMVMAEDDPVLPPSLADGMEERVPRLQKVLIPDCGHWTQQERPEQTSEALVSFARSLPPWG